MLLTLLQAALGGAAGSALRVLVGQFVMFPLGTFAVNVLGSLLIGVTWAGWQLRVGEGLPPAWWMVGFLGGFTTFSTFSLDTMRLIEGGRMLSAGSYVLGTVALSLLACWAGLALARAVWA